MEPTLPQGAGYGILIGLGVFFAVLMNSVTWVQNKYTKFHSNKVDEFTTASRNIPFGLMVVSIVSSWTWSLTLLQSATESYNLGVSGSFNYAVGGLLQVSVFSFLANRTKRNSHSVTTFPEMAYFRFGNAGHLAFLWCGIVCNAIVSACILLGGGAVFHAVTGVNEYAVLFLLPLGCAIYISFGGLRATFISDATHTFILLIFLIIFVFVTFTSGDKIGSPGKMVELLSKLSPVEDNYHGSYMTFRSKNGGIFMVQSIITGFGLVTCDQAYWSRAIASDPKKTSPAYFCASCCWFVIPFAMGATLGLGARALSNYSDFPSLSSDEVSAGLAAVAAASYLLGKGGSVMILLMVFLSVTSSFSGELISASTLLSYDIYKKYFFKDATSDQIVRVAKISVFVWALFAFALSAIFKAVGISMGWLFNFLGVATASGVFPIALTFTWKDLNRQGAVLGSMGGMLLALIAWLVMCKAYTGSINVINLSDQWVSFTGNVAAIVLGGVISIIVSLIKPANFDFESTKNRTILSETSKTLNSTGQISQDDQQVAELESDDNGKQEEEKEKFATQIESQSDEEDLIAQVETDDKFLDAQYKLYLYLFFLLSFVVIIVIYVPLASCPYVFSKKFFSGFVGIIIAWLFFTFFFTIILPLYEARKFLWNITLLLFGSKQGVSSP